MNKEAIEAFNAYQNSGIVHPLTCGNNRTDEAHTEYQAKHGGDFGQLVATENGIACPVCGWKQPANSPISAMFSPEAVKKMLEYDPFGLRARKPG